LGSGEEIFNAGIKLTKNFNQAINGITILGASAPAISEKSTVISSVNCKFTIKVHNADGVFQRVFGGI
jgi:hypothetical protein